MTAEAPATLRVSKRANRDRFEADIRYTDPRTGVRRRVKRLLAATSKRDAEAEARSLLTTLVTRIGGSEKRAAFSGLAAKWLETRSPGLKPSTKRFYEGALRNHLVPAFGDVDVRQIDVEAVEDLRAALAQALAPKTVNNLLGVLSKLLQDGAAWGYLPANPVAAVTPLRLPRRTPTWWSPEESSAFLAEVARSEPAYLLVFTLALRSGLRFGELAALRWPDVHLLDARSHIVVSRSWDYGSRVEGGTKNNRVRLVPLAADAEKLLRGVPRANRVGRVIMPTRGDDRPVVATTVRAALIRLAKAAQVPVIRFHDLRHTFCSQLAAAGVPIALIQQWAGHSDIQTTMRYAHLSPLHNADAVDLLCGPSPTL